MVAVGGGGKGVGWQGKSQRDGWATCTEPRDSAQGEPGASRRVTAGELV